MKTTSIYYHILRVNATGFSEGMIHFPNICTVIFRKMSFFRHFFCFQFVKTMIYCTKCVRTLCAQIRSCKEG